MRALDQMYFLDFYRQRHANTAEFTVFSSAPGTFSETEHMSGHKLSLHPFKKIEILSGIFSDHNGLKLEINCNQDRLKQ